MYNIRRPLAERREPTVVLLSSFCVAWQFAGCHLAIDTWYLTSTPHPTPSPGSRIPRDTRGVFALRPSGRRPVANFWRQVPLHMAKLPLQVVKLSQDTQIWSQHDPKIAQLGAKMSLRPPTLTILEPSWTSQPLQKY